jgi:hypothetical protein
MYAYDLLLEWAKDANVSGYQFPLNAPSRKTYLDSLYDRFNMRGAKPIETSITLYPNKLANVITFSFEEMVNSLIKDQNLMQRKNLLILNNNIPVTEDVRSDINSGSWYKSASIRLCIDGNDVLCPIILFIDKTQIDQLSKWSLEPVLFTLGIFNRQTRNLSSAWRPLGLVTNTVRMSTASHAQLGKQV